MKKMGVTSVTVPAKLERLSATLEFVRATLVVMGLDETTATKMQLVTEEAAVNVIENSFDPGEEGEYTIAISRLPGAVMVAVEDQGLPVDYQRLEKDEKSGLGMLLMKKIADEVRFLNLPGVGKRIEFVKNLPVRGIEEYQDTPPPADAVAADPAEPIEIRRLREGEEILLSRCVYRSYGYTYPNNSIYYPEKFRECLRNGTIRSSVATNSNGEIVGHLAMIFEKPEDRVAESGQAVVDPRYRGRNLFKKLKEFASAWGREGGMYGLFSEPVTIHGYSQKGNLSLGARQTGILLSVIPNTLFFKKIHEDEQVQRQTCAIYYLRLNDEPERDVFLPARHRAIVKEIYSELNFRRKFAEAPARLDLPGHSSLSVSVNEAWSAARIGISALGADFEDALRFRVGELRRRRIDVILLDFRLSAFDTPLGVEIAERHGFFTAAVIPELDEGDVLRMEYLNNVSFDPSHVTVVSELGKKILAYVDAERLRAEEARG